MARVVTRSKCPDNEGLRCLQVFMSTEADRALGKSQGGNNSQGPIYKVPVSGPSLLLPPLLSSLDSKHRLFQPWTSPRGCSAGRQQ